MQIEMNQVSELKGLVDQLRGELTVLNGENERLARRVAPEGDSASSLGASGIVEREGASLRATPPARASSRPGSRSRSRGSQSITPDEAQLLSAVVALEEENHWLQRCLAQVREEHPDRDYDGHAPALKTVGPGRWTEQRAQDRADKQEMKEIMEYVCLSATLYKLGGGRRWTGGWGAGGWAADLVASGMILSDAVSAIAMEKNLLLPLRCLPQPGIDTHGNPFFAAWVPGAGICTRPVCPQRPTGGSRFACYTARATAQPRSNRIKQS